MTHTEYSAALEILGPLDMITIKKNFTFESGVDIEGLSSAIRERVFEKLIQREKNFLTSER